MSACTCAPLPDGRLVNAACPLHGDGYREPAPRELPEYADTHDGQTEPSAWPPLDDEGFPF